MKDITVYLNESLKQNEIMIDEGLKDWIKKAAITTALAASLLSPQIAKADIIMTPHGNEPAKELAQSIVSDYNKNGEDVDVLVTPFLSNNKEMAKSQADASLALQLSKIQKSNTVHINKILKNYKVYKNKEGKYAFAFILNGGSLNSNVTIAQ